MLLHSVRRAALRTLAIIGIGLMAAAMVGCKKDEVIIDQKWSVNVAKLSPEWPVVKKLTPPQREVFERLGKPDFVRAQWTPTWDIKTRDQLKKEMEGKKAKDLPPTRWVYLKLNAEIEFNGANYEEVPLTDEVRLICQYGDPEEVRESVNGGPRTWTFYSVGKSFRMANGRIIDTREFPAMSGYPKL